MAIDKDDKLAIMKELLNCGTSIHLWKYAMDGHLVSNTSDQLVLNTIFEHTGNKEYMLKLAETYTAPLIMGGQMGLMWCAIYDRYNGKTHAVYVLGPVFNSEISGDTIRESVSKYNIDLPWRNAYIELMQSLPVVSSILFFQYALMMHYCVTGEKITRSDLHFREWVPAKAEDIENAPQKNRVQVWIAEQELLRMVREGNINYQTAMSQANLMSNGVQAKSKNPLLQAIVSCTSFTSLCVREAIRAGLSPDTAYSVGDTYIQSMVDCKTITELRSINHTMYEDFIIRVHKYRANPNISMQIQLCMEYIDKNITQPLSLSVLADYAGYSEYHLSRKFKQEIGISITTYIKQSRIEDAKHRLLATNDSISKIALDLQFCSSSHFSDSFQKIVGIKPQQYRQENQRGRIK